MPTIIQDFENMKPVEKRKLNVIEAIVLTIDLRKAYRLLNTYPSQDLISVPVPKVR
jgi:hypothetical protein